MRCLVASDCSTVFINDHAGFSIVRLSSTHSKLRSAMGLVFDLLFTLLTRLPRFIREAIMPDMLIPPISNNSSKIQLARIAHVYFEHPDLTKFAKFADDFGFVVAQKTKDKVYFRGYGIDPFVYVASKSRDGKQRFGGAAFVAASQHEFDKAARLEGAIIGSLGDAPGGGKIITFNRPDDTFFHVVYGQEERETTTIEPTATHESQGPYNTPFAKPRQGALIHFRRTGAWPASRMSNMGNASREVPALPPWPSSST